MQKGAAYWMGLKYFNDSDPIFLAQIQRGITNFVKILTGKNIPVQYATSGDSMTDGETVYIASKITKETIDYTVGLALHEASHVLLTDFDYLNKKKGNALKRLYSIPEEDHDVVFLLVNFIEDRRIDNYVYTNAPGYQYYYEELYRKSFFSNIVDKNLQSDEFITPTWDAYFFRIINILNRNSNLDALPGLREIYDLIDIKNIDRLDFTSDSVKVAVQIYDIIKEHVIDSPISNGFSGGKGYYDKSPTELKIKEFVEKQKNFINSKYRKKRVSKTVRDKINSYAQSKTNILNVSFNKTDIPVIVTEDWKEFFGSRWRGNEEYNNKKLKHINKGFTQGKQLLKLLKDRDTTKQEIFENLKKGKLNSRKLFQASFQEDIFYRIEKENYKNLFLHISLDLSTSMSYDDKFLKTLQTTAAIAYAACHLNNFDVEISLRGTQFIHGDKAYPEKPVLVYAFNSKKHSIKHLKTLLNGCDPEGATPEGLCFEVIEKNLPTPNYYTDVYLLNISDGMPTLFTVDYKGDDGIQHTKKVIDKIRKNGVKVLSYFMETSSAYLGMHDIDLEKDFIKMYGKDAKFIDTDNVYSIAKTINNLLLSNKVKVF